MKDQNLSDEAYWRKAEKAHRRGKIAVGLLLLTAGVLFILRETGFPVPWWIFSWKTILIAAGLAIGVRHNFTRPTWIILVLIGTGFHLADFYPELNVRAFVIPAILITVGLLMIFRPRRSRHPHCGRFRRGWHNRTYDPGRENIDPAFNTGDDYLESTTVFGGTKKNVISKHFKGGEITAVFGGAEINFMHADFDQPVEIDVTAVMGGIKLIIPPNWEVKSDITTVLGGMEDKRPLQDLPAGPKKSIRLTGTAFLGGIDINSY